MEVDADEVALRALAAGQTMDYALWPALLQNLTVRIDKIAHEVFPIPAIPPPTLPTIPPPPRLFAPLPSSDPLEPPSSSPDDAGPSSQDPEHETNKENANPSGSGSGGQARKSSSTLSAPPLTSSTAASPTATNENTPPGTRHGTLGPTMPLTPPTLEPGQLPTQLAALLGEILATLRDVFHTAPPHTIQRLAELVLSPKQHYRSLAAYLHALDRVVHVTSGADLYPLPPAVADMANMSKGLVNGVSGPDEEPSGMSAGGGEVGAAASAGTMSDDALGGAILTPIPWLARRVEEAALNGADGSMQVDPTDFDGDHPNAAQAQTVAQLGQGGTGTGAGSSRHTPSASSSASNRNLERQVRTESTETIEGPNGMGHIETVTVSVSVNGIPSLNGTTTTGGVLHSSLQRGVTQGEVLRQEQEMGVVPVTQLARSNAAASASGSGTSGSGGEHAEDEGVEDHEGGEEGVDDETPHARGPDEIGAADIGQQSATSSVVLGGHGGVQMHGIDVEAAVGRKHPHSEHEEGVEEQPDDAAANADHKVKGKAEESGETAAVPQSPKRQADDEADEDVAKKRVKSDRDHATGQDASEGGTAEQEDVEIVDDDFVVVPSDVPAADVSSVDTTVSTAGDMSSKNAAGVEVGGERPEADAERDKVMPDAPPSSSPSDQTRE